MNATIGIVGAVGLVVGWYGRQLWDDFLDWVSEMTGTAKGALWDLCAIVGMVVICIGVGWAADHYWWSQR